MPKKTRYIMRDGKRIKQKFSGGAWYDDVWSGIKKAYNWVSDVKPFGKIKKYIPMSTSIPYAGQAIEFLADAGYGNKRKRRTKK